MNLLRAVTLGLFLGCSSAALAQAPAAPASANAPAEPADVAATQAIISKLNPYVALLNRTMRASDSIARYESWVKMNTGPTGKERVIYGLYSLYDVRGEVDKAKAAATLEPALPELDAAMADYITTYEALAPLVGVGTRAVPNRTLRSNGP